MKITYTNGKTVSDPVIQIWDDLSNEQAGYFRAFWCDSADATTGSPVVGYCSPGGSYRTITAVIAELRKLGHTEPVYRNGRKLA